MITKYFEVSSTNYRYYVTQQDGDLIGRITIGGIYIKIDLKP